jgi:hypothetical protein
VSYSNKPLPDSAYSPQPIESRLNAAGTGQERLVLTGGYVFPFQSNCRSKLLRQVQTNLISLHDFWWDASGLIEPPGKLHPQVLRYLDAIAPGATLADLLAESDPALSALQRREATQRVRALTATEREALDF